MTVVAPVVLAAAALFPTALASAAPCPDVQVVFARGTFEPPGVGVTGQAFVDALVAKSGGRSVEVYPVDYPASLDFGAAVDGVTDASNEVRGVVASCPNAKIVLGGYSQGAAVAAYVTEDSVPDGYQLPAGLTEPLPASVANHVAAVVLFGKPSSDFMHLVYAPAPPIVIGSRYRAKTIDSCVPDDPVCSAGGRDRQAHSQYVSDGSTDRAADFAVGRLARR